VLACFNRAIFKSSEPAGRYQVPRTVVNYFFRGMGQTFCTTHAIPHPQEKAWKNRALSNLSRRHPAPSVAR
jgi:hypothetical protein